MSSPYDKLKRILTLEKDQGFRNTAVIGGLERFLTYWEKEARRKASGAGHAVSVDEVMQALTAYGDLSLPERARSVDTLLEGLNQESPSSDEPEELEGSPQNAASVVRPPASRGNGDVPVAKPPAKSRPSRGDASAPEYDPDGSLTMVKGISTTMESRLARLGLVTVRDLLYHFPRRYDDLSELKTINRLALGDEVTVVGVVSDVKSQRTRTGRTMVRVTLGDGTGAIEARWFQPYLYRRFRVGEEIVISGRVDEYLGRLLFSGPEWEPLQRDLLNTARLVPTYPLTEGVGARWLRRVIRNALDAWAPTIADPLPENMVRSLQLLDLGTALRQMHFPDSREILEQARQRLCFDEFLLLQLGVLRQRSAWRSRVGYALTAPWKQVDNLVQELPFTLTNAQSRAIRAVMEDLARSMPMSRLLEGDVGSGKTVVAVAAALATVRNGLQVAVMAPTSILAEQHCRTFAGMLAAFADIQVELLVGSLSEAEKERIRQRIASGESQIIVGTHALIQEAVQFARLGLVVVDEQHRFGVQQRGTLRAKGSEFQPHMLAMSATPIPRTLAMTIYGDMDLSVIDELPPHRQEVVTAVRDRSSREGIYSFINGQVRQGRQAFIICPLVEESENTDAKAAVAEHQRLQQEVFPHLRVGLLHGRLSAQEKDEVMSAFKDGLYDILVSTAVVEVGIDVPNATVILIEGAERFGLAQLHQFRGRVGRGEAKSYCVLLSDDASELSLKRLRLMEESNDGFFLAEKDLEMRGPGDFFGVRQHGLPSLKVARLGDTAILEKARSEALALFERDPDLTHPEHGPLAAEVERLWSNIDIPTVEVTP